MNVHNPSTGFKAAVKGPGQYVTIEDNVDYMGMTKMGGCVFVEGHTKLSPVTAKRFAARERATIVEVSAHSPGAYFVESEQHEHEHKVDILEQAGPGAKEASSSDDDDDDPIDEAENEHEVSRSLIVSCLLAAIGPVCLVVVARGYGYYYNF